jgi:hypothetical protein
MLWFILHHIFKNFTFLENQTRNLTTFLLGTVIYVLFYSYIGSMDFSNNLFFKKLFGFFYYIVMADGFAMAILYKNFYKQTILTEIKETLGTSGPKTVTTLEPIIETNELIEEENENEDGENEDGEDNE